MTDIHCHILPYTDDGADDMDEALTMARMAYDSGVESICATPHFRGEESALSDLEENKATLLQLQEQIDSEGIPLKLYGGAEILCLPETLSLAHKHQLPTIGLGNYILCEFYFDESPYFMSECLDGFASCGYIPVVAHPERYECVQRDPKIIENWFRRGYIIQINKGSVLGAFGRTAKDCAEFLLELGLVHAVASDAHGCDRRTPHMGQVREWAEENLHGEYANILFSENPRRILEGREMIPVG